MKKPVMYFLFVLIFLLGCATQSFEPEPDPPGFVWGLIHGFILVFNYIASLFTDFEIYAFPNNGGWYDFGYFLGVMLFFGGGGAGTGKRRR